MPDSLGAGDPKLGAARPSFTGYWKRSKDQQASQSLTFVTSKLGQPSAPNGNEGQTEPSAEAKAKERRQQVRKAQRQHRQRKANYTKQLEMDITKLRDDIARVEKEVASLKNKNGAMRDQLAGPVAATVPQPAVDFSAGMAFSTALAPDYTVFLDLPDYSGTPTYQVRRNSPPSALELELSLPDWSASDKAGGSSYAGDTLSSGVTPTSTLGGNGFEDLAALETLLSEEQTDQAVNFILALEHVCWSHIDASCFEHNHDHQQCVSSPQQQQPSKMDCPLLAADGDEAEDFDGALNGHTLSATALALQSAPLSVFTRINDLQEYLAPSPPQEVPAIPTPIPVEWSTKALTLANLRRLAATLNLSDGELAPVQAWFELAALYGVGAATDGAVLARLRSELASEMSCVTFGAAVDRDIFEGVLERVMGFLPRSWRDDGERTKSSPGVFQRLINSARGGSSGSR
ncbi:hypothetical protein F5Y10DRAFT_257420 [Nemania abortiva]|nr:hypothetical protein F5Y10DRAFT_257420 [Nemania abortiva]